MDVLRRWRQWIRPACFTLYFICLMVALPLCILEMNRKGAPDHVQAWFIGGLFVMMAVPISFWGILQHIVYYTQPELQRHIIRVLWMVPIYALNAWFALRFPSAAIYLDTLRECYEAYVIYNFMRFLINFLHQEHPRLDLMLQNKPQVKHFFPFCLLPAWPPGKVFFNRCKHGVMQYTVVRPAMTAVALITQLCGKYDEGNFNFTSAWSYIVIINNLSQIWAMYCLVLFYKGTKEELAPIRPLPKFLCVKAVVFLSFWQSTVIAALAKLNVIPANGTWVFYHSVEEVATGLQDFLICLEMFLAAIAHYYSFPHTPYVDHAAERGDCCSTFFSMWDVRDMRDDVLEHARYIRRGVQKRFIKPNGSPANSSERTPLLNSQAATDPQHPSYAEGPNTPLVLVEERPTFPGAYDARSLSETDWEKSTETFHVRSTTPSMVNFAEFSTSIDVSSIASGGAGNTTPRGVNVDTLSRKSDPGMEVADRRSDQEGKREETKSSGEESLLLRSDGETGSKKAERGKNTGYEGARSSADLDSSDMRSSTSTHPTGDGKGDIDPVGRGGKETLTDERGSAASGESVDPSRLVQSGDDALSSPQQSQGDSSEHKSLNDAEDESLEGSLTVIA
ncbi:hypothetical protein ACOMHN_048905 [Nucella lapillus]